MKDKDFLWLNLRELPYFRAMLRAVEAQFYQEFELPAPTIDLGCGDGHFATVTFDRKLDVGLDPWAGPIHQAARGGGYRSLVQADGGRMPFPDEHFASAISNSVLEHIKQVEPVLAETRRVLKPGAPFLFCVPNPRYLTELSIPLILKRFGLASIGRVYTEWFRQMSRTHHAVDPNNWQSWLEGAGFRLEKWWHYFSPQAMRVLEWGHYFGAPTLLTHAISKHWIIAPWRWNLFLTERLVRQHAIAQSNPQGTYTFYVARSI
ncbi:MAG: class I SAM-dependent methyltransferase [Anaerolineales bacterium]|jgi:SAM-dependent methyltransferase